MAAQRFNPFEDRLSRDIRNELSESILKVIAHRSLVPAEAVAARYEAQDLPPAHRAYIGERLDRYGKALAVLSGGTSNVLEIAAVLWDHDLFFEVHEVLEPAWMKATGDDKLILQALIRAAGVYIYLELGYGERAAKISAKALPVLTRFRQQLGQCVAVEPLITALKHCSYPAPRLSC